MGGSEVRVFLVHYINLFGDRAAFSVGAHNQEDAQGLAQNYLKRPSEWRCIKVEIA
jgi:hypothetical protein